MFKKTLFAVLTFIVSGQGFAATVNVYTDRTAWESALAGFTINTETFSNPITAADVITLDNGIISTASPSGLNSTANNVEDGQYYAYTCSRVPCTYPAEYDWALPSATYAIGADFFSLAPQRIDIDGVKMDIDSLGFVGMTINDSIGGTDGFYGIISDTLFDNIDFRCYLSCGDGFHIDNFSIASAPPPVPVPAAIWLFGTAIIGLVGFRKRRNVA